MGVGDLSLTPILNFKGERLQARTGPLYPPLSTLPFPLHNTILKKHCDYEKTCWIQIVAVMGIRIKGELIGVRDLSLTPILNFEGERLQARAGPLLQLLLKNPQVIFVITNLWFVLFYLFF